MPRIIVAKTERGSGMFIKSLLGAAGLCLAATSANAVTYGGFFSGANERPNAIVSAGTGYGTVEIIGGTIMKVNFTFSGLGTNLSGAHLHCCAATTGNGPVAVGFPALPLAKLGTYSRTFNLTQAIYGNGFLNPPTGDGTVANARTRLLTGLASGRAYLNLHTTGVPGGEIRANLALVPEPASWAMMVVGFGLVGGAIRRRSAALAAA